MQQLAMGSNPKLESKLSLSSEIYHSDQVLTEPLGEQLWVAGIYKTEVSPPWLLEKEESLSIGVMAYGTLLRPQWMGTYPRCIWAELIEHVVINKSNKKNIKSGWEMGGH